MAKNWFPACAGMTNIAARIEIRKSFRARSYAAEMLNRFAGLGTFRAMPFEQDFDDFTRRLRAAFLRIQSDREIFEARDRSTIHTHEMRMLGEARRLAGLQQLEAADRIAKLKTRQQTCV